MSKKVRIRRTGDNRLYSLREITQLRAILQTRMANSPNVARLNAMFMYTETPRNAVAMNGKSLRSANNSNTFVNDYRNMHKAILFEVHYFHCRNWDY